MANEVPGVTVPDQILERMKAADTASKGKITGVKIAREMIKEVSDHVAGFALSAPFGNVKVALAAINKLSLDEL